MAQTKMQVGFIESLTASVTELNILDGATANATELNLLDNVSGLVQADLIKLAAINSTATELNLLNSVSGLVQADLTKLAAVDSTAVELNLLNGVSGLVQADLTKLAAIDSSAAELNLLDGVSGLVQADLTKLAAIDSTAAEINLLDALDRGSILYGNASGVTTVLGQGTTDQVLTSDGTDISWEDASAGATLSGSTNNTVVTVTGANAMTGEAGLTYDGTSLVTQKAGAAAYIQIDSYSTTAGVPGILQMRHSNHGTLGTHAAMDSGDELGNIDFSGSNGSAFARGTLISSTTTEAWTGSNNGAKLIFFTNANNANSVSTALVINENQQTLHPDGTAGAPSMSFLSNTNMGFFRPAGSVIGISSCGYEYLRIGCGPRIFIKESANAKMSYGITINQVSTDNEVLAFKSSDISHGVTSVTETDTYAKFEKEQEGNGGLRIVGLSDSGARAVYIRTIARDQTNTRSTSASAPFQVTANRQCPSDNTLYTNLEADKNIVVFGNMSAAKFIFDSDGCSFQDGGGWTNFDDYCDPALVRSIGKHLTREDDPIQANFNNFLAYNRCQLEAAKLVTFNDFDGHHFINTSRLAMLHNGAIWQLSERIKAVETQLALTEGKIDGNNI